MVNDIPNRYHHGSSYDFHYVFLIIVADVTIGFIDSIYSVFENESMLVIQIGLLEGSLQREVIITLSTADLTAVGMHTFSSINIII